MGRLETHSKSTQHKKAHIIADTRSLTYRKRMKLK